MKKVCCFLLVALCAVFAAHAAGAAPEKIGEEVAVRFDTAHPYVVAPEKAGEVIWSEVLEFPGATYIAPHFSRFHLAPDDVLIVRSRDGLQSWKYTGLGRGERGDIGGFWAVHIKGDAAIVELIAKHGGEYGFSIDKFARGYRADEMEAAFAPESICGADDSNWAKCYQASEPTIYDKSRAVARITIQGTSACTAWLIGNAGDIMTNHHCITSQADASNTDYEFMAEGATCGTDCATFGGCPGIIEAVTGTLTSTDVNLDYSLVRLPVNLTPTYGFLRLRATLPVINERVYLPGHPGAWGKRFAVTSSDAQNPSGFCEIDTLTAPICVGGIVPEVGYMCDTQGGSSGSPVIAYSDHKVVALHHCSGCPNTGLPIPDLIALMGPNLPPGAVFDPAGTVRLDQDAYSCSDVVGIEVRDDSLIGLGTTTVNVSSNTEPGGETVTLTETPAASGVFVGSIQTTTAAVPSPGQVSVTHGDTLTVRYIDADDGAGGINVPRTDTAVIDCVVPVITNVGSSNVTGNSADVTFDTNEPANSTATYGDAIPPGSSTSNAALVTSHTVHLTGLQPCRTYFFSVSASDAAGNSASDNNGGIYYTFSTGANTNPTYGASGLPISIPDNDPAGAASTIAVSDINTVTDVNVRIHITHTFDGDLDIFLIGPNGVQVELSTDNGGSGENFDNTVFDDEAATSITTGAAPFAGSFRPESPLSALDGISAQGNWTLKVVDDAGIDVGTIDLFEVILTYPPQPCGAFVRAQSQTASDSCSAGGPGNGDGIIDPGELVSIVVRAVNTGTTPATNITGTLTSPTPGVSIVNGSSGYPDLAIGASALGNTPFSVLVSPGFPCGTPIDFEVTFSTAQGTWSSTFSFPTGTAVFSANNYPSTDTPKPIADVATTTSTIAVAAPGTVGDVNVTINLNHTFDADLDIFLVGPNGTRVELSTDNGGSGDNYINTVFDDAAATLVTAGVAPFTGTFRPEGSLATLNGILAAGNWTLELTDDLGADVGTLNSWSLQITTPGGYSCNVCAGGCPDADGDGVCDSVDNCPAVANASQANADGDAFGDACDPCPNDPQNDLDGDGVCGNVDNCPTVANPSQANADADLFGDACDPCPADPFNDVDSDGVCGDVDNCRSVANPSQANADGDAFGDACDPCPADPLNDVDGDGVCGNADNCPTTANPTQADGDGDGLGDACDPCLADPANDADNDGVCGNVDNCPATANSSQANSDGDAAGDACDPCPLDPLNDADGDGVCGNVDNCPTTANSSQANSDGDAAGDACDPCPLDPLNDADGDGVCGNVDNCPTIANSSQANADGDAAGDACDPCPLDPQNDVDGDGVCGNVDNCPAVANADQADADGDGEGDACETGCADSDGDGISDCDDACPNSILDPTVVVPPTAPTTPPPGTAPSTTLPCDSGVPNYLLADGCTISDKIAACDAASHNKGQFDKCVKALLNQLKKQHIITEAQRKAIDKCVKKYKKRDVHAHTGGSGTSSGANDL